MINFDRQTKQLTNSLNLNTHSCFLSPGPSQYRKTLKARLRTKLCLLSPSQKPSASTIHLPHELKARSVAQTIPASVALPVTLISWYSTRRNPFASLLECRCRHHSLFCSSSLCLHPLSPVRLSSMPICSVLLCSSRSVSSIAGAFSVLFVICLLYTSPSPRD